MTDLPTIRAMLDPTLSNAEVVAAPLAPDWDTPPDDPFAEVAHWPATPAAVPREPEYAI